MTSRSVSPHHFPKKNQIYLYQIDATIFRSVTEIHKRSETMHQELLDIISTLLDGTISDMSSSSSVSVSIFSLLYLQA